MTRFIFSFLLLTLAFEKPYAQTAATADALALQIPEAMASTPANLAHYIQQHFTSDTARVRAVYMWITNNIQYDAARLAVPVDNTKPPPPAEEILQTRKGVCQGYATLFVSLCEAMNIKAMMIPGYGKIYGTITPLSHAWVAAQLGGAWYLFDPTWGAGYLENNRFVKAFNNRFYKVAPEKMLEDHMPFDPMYQLVNYPLTNEEFIKGQTAMNKAKPFFNYTDTLQQYSLLNSTEKLKAEYRRLSANGVVHPVIKEQINYLKKGMQVYGGNDAFTEAMNMYKQSVALYNESYVAYKNKKFAGIEDKSLQQLIDSIYSDTKQARSLLFGITPANDSYRQALADAHKNIEQFQKVIMAEKEVVTRYLGLDKEGRQRFFGGR